MPPARCKHMRPDGEPVGLAITVERGVKVETLLVDAAEDGFNGITVTYLIKLITHLEIVVHPMPPLEHDVVKLLLKDILPHLTEEEILERMMRRHRMKLKFQAVLTEEVVSAAAELVGDDAASELKGEVAG